jgi:flagellar hook-associated protein 3 FlgL
MALRIDPNLSSELLAAIETSDQQQNTAVEQLASGRTVNSPSDNPAATVAVILNHAQASQDDTFLRNVDNLQGMYQTADSTLSSAVQLMTQAISLGTEAANGTLTSSNRQSIANQMQGIMNQMVGLANTSYQGEYLFSGTAVHTTPYVLDATAPDGVDYQGNTDTNTVQVLTGQSVQLNVPGSQIFSNSGGNIFGALNQMITALESGTGIEAAATAVQNAFQEVNQQRVFYGNALDQLSSASTFLNNDKVQLSQQENNLVAADPAQAATNLSQAEVQNQAVIAATSKILDTPTLFDYLA